MSKCGVCLLWSFSEFSTHARPIFSASRVRSRLKVKCQYCDGVICYLATKTAGREALNNCCLGWRCSWIPLGRLRFLWRKQHRVFFCFFYWDLMFFFYIYLVSVGSKAFKESFVTGITVSSNNIPFTNLLSLLIVKVSAKRVTYLFSAFKWGHLNSTRANCLIATRNCLSNLWLFFLQKAKLSTLLTGAVAQKVDRNISGFTGVVGRSVDQNSTL